MVTETRERVYSLSWTPRAENRLFSFSGEAIREIGKRIGALQYDPLAGPDCDMYEGVSNHFRITLDIGYVILYLVDTHGKNVTIFDTYRER